MVPVGLGELQSEHAGNVAVFGWQTGFGAPLTIVQGLGEHEAVFQHT